jgi:hypothetical protein
VLLLLLLPLLLLLLLLLLLVVQHLAGPGSRLQSCHSLSLESSSGNDRWGVIYS